jgi:hypothetical protein
MTAAERRILLSTQELTLPAAGLRKKLMDP